MNKKNIPFRILSDALIQEAFTNYEDEINLLRNNSDRASKILNLYAKHMPVGFLRHMRDEINKEREPSSARPLNLIFLEDLEMKLSLHEKLHNKSCEKIDLLLENRTKIWDKIIESEIHND